MSIVREAIQALVNVVETGVVRDPEDEAQIHTVIGMLVQAEE